jgi:hypothetical protein
LGIARGIVSGSQFSTDDIAANDRAIVRYEQELVQSRLDALRESNAAFYTQLIGEVNGTLDNPLSSLTDRAYSSILDSVRTELGREIDFANKADRIMIGDAITASIRENAQVVCTGSRIQRNEC